MRKENLPVFVFDSGVGGVSVLKELVKQLPHEDFEYFGDCRNAPYGTKTVSAVRELTGIAFENAVKRGIKAAVIACNTATAAAVQSLREQWREIPIIGIEPAIKPAAESGDRPHVLIMATPMTLRLEKFRALEERLTDLAEFTALPCRGLVELIEAGKAEAPETVVFLRKLLQDELRDPPDAIVLGCTHYPFVKNALKSVFGEEMRFFDGAEGTARQLKRVLEKEGLQTERTTPGRVTFASSDGSRERLELMKTLFEKEI